MATKAQLAAAQKDIAAQRARRNTGRSKATSAAQHAAFVQPDVEHVNVEELMVDLPSPSRVVVGLILGLATAGAVGYGVSLVMSYALAGVVTLTGSAVLLFAMQAVIWLLGVYAAWRLSTWAGTKVFSSVVLPEGLVSRCYASLAGGFGEAKDTVGAWVDEAQPVQRARGFTENVREAVRTRGPVAA